MIKTTRLSFIIVGTNHRYSPLELRERISFSQRHLIEALSFLKRPVLKATVILSTCNRVEIYASVEDTNAGIQGIESFISQYHELEKCRILPYLYRHSGKEAVRHIFSVASGLDSLILGETQILSQLKEAFFKADGAGFVDEFLRWIFGHAIHFAKRVHRSTSISEGKTSVGSITVDFIKEKIGALSHKNILIIGGGRVTELVLKYLKKESPHIVFVANRTYERARELALQIGAQAVRLDKLKELLKEADVIISATASPHFILRKEVLEKAVNKKVLIVDLALPRDVEPSVREIENVELFCLEDLNSIIKKNIERKIEEAEKIRNMIDIEVENLCQGFSESLCAGGGCTRLEPEPAPLL